MNLEQWWEQAAVNERVALVAERVMQLENVHLGDPKNNQWEGGFYVAEKRDKCYAHQKVYAAYEWHYVKQPTPDYQGDIAAAWQVLNVACDWLFSRRKRFFDSLQRQASPNGVLVAWPDVLVVLRDKLSECICLAALEASDITEL